MSAEANAPVEELLRQAGALEDGPSRIALLEEAVRLADSHNDVALGYRVRKELTKAGTFGGYPEKALVSFSWCLAQCDRRPEEFRDIDLLWHYKWVTNHLALFPQFSREQIEAMLEDMTRRYRRAGVSLRAVQKLRRDLAVEMGDPDAAARHHLLWLASPRGWPADCPACDQNALAEYLVFAGKDEAALEAARPILQGTLRCTCIPHCTLALVLLPLFRLGRLAETVAHHQKGYRLILRNRNYLKEAARHLAFLTLTDNLSRCVVLLERHLPWALETAEVGNRFEFYLAARLLAERLRDAGRAAVRLRLPRAFPLYEDGGRYETAVLLAWLEGALQGLAARFDARNGNDSFRRRLAENRRLKEQVIPFPVSGRPSAKGAGEP
ncbi:MAG TPA: hypothetical protein VJ739_08850 [Gemmataceae bacterium]|nr:hypothetical protein [Gemmataceae bacterium]